MEESYRRSNFCSVLLNIWQCKYVLKAARNKQVQEKDLMRMSEQNNTANLVSDLARSWDMELTQSKPSFMRAFHRSFFCRFFLYSCIGVLVWFNLRLSTSAWYPSTSTLRDTSLISSEIPRLIIQEVTS